MNLKKSRNSLQILGINLNSTELVEVLAVLVRRVEKSQKTFVATPNPEFLVYAQKHVWFKKILNSADFAIPDGIGLVWASWLLRTQPRIRQRVAGADLASRLLKLAQQRRWRVGVVGARGGEVSQRRQLIAVLKQKYPGAQIFNLEDTPEWKKETFQLVFACQGMGEQEKWIEKNMPQAKATILIGVGGSLDFLSGFSHRAPFWLRKVGLEWLWRFICRPGRHLKRIWTACIVFPVLVIYSRLTSIPSSQRTASLR